MSRFQAQFLFVLPMVFLAAGCGENATMPVSGTVYGELLLDNGEPAADVLVMMEGTDRTAVSDANGSFVISEVIAVDEESIGKYYTIRGEGKDAGTPIGFLISRFKVKGSQSYSVGTVVVPPTGNVSGKLTLDGESDHSGVQIELVGTSLATATRADGSFLIEHVPAHEGYSVLCSRAGWMGVTLEMMMVGDEQVPITVVSGETIHLGESELAPEL